MEARQSSLFFTLQFTYHYNEAVGEFICVGHIVASSSCWYNDLLTDLFFTKNFLVRNCSHMTPPYFTEFLTLLFSSSHCEPLNYITPHVSEALIDFHQLLSYVPQFFTFISLALNKLAQAYASWTIMDVLDICQLKLN